MAVPRMGRKRWPGKARGFAALLAANLLRPPQKVQTQPGRTSPLCSSRLCNPDFARLLTWLLSVSRAAPPAAPACGFNSWGLLSLFFLLG